MADYPLVPIDQLNFTESPSRQHLVAAMHAGGAGALSVEQILSLTEAGDISGLDTEVANTLAGAASDDTVDDTDELIYKAGTTLKRASFAAGLIASIFKVSRAIANACFAAASFKLYNAAGTPRALSFNITSLTADRTVTFPNKDVDLGNAAKFAILQDQKGSGTSGGSSVANAWTTRVLNAEVWDADNIVALSSNQWTPAIDCLCHAEAPFFQTSQTRLRIWNVTDGVEVARGPAVAAANGNNGSCFPSVAARLSAGKTYRLEYYCLNAQATNGLGSGAGDGGAEVFAQVFLRGLAA